jgi:hypothetical protein
VRTEVATGIDELKRQFSASALTAREDGQGGAYVIIEPIALGPRYTPNASWIGFHMTAQYPYSDIYPVFIGADVSRADGIPFAAPITHGHQFEGRAAIQVSRRNNSAQSASQRAASKLLKILDFLEKLPQ